MRKEHRSERKGGTELKPASVLFLEARLYTILCSEALRAGAENRRAGLGSVRNYILRWLQHDCCWAGPNTQSASEGVEDGALASECACEPKCLRLLVRKDPPG